MSPVVAVSEPHTNRLSVEVVGQATSLFLVISFLFCVTAIYGWYIALVFELGGNARPEPLAPFACLCPG